MPLSTAGIAIIAPLAINQFGLNDALVNHHAALPVHLVAVHNALPTLANLEALPTVAAVPATPAAPAKPSADGATVKAAKAANTLTNQYGVDYDDIVATLLKPLGVEMFGSLTTDQEDEVLKGLESWVAELSTLTEEFDGIRDMAKGTEHENTIAEGLDAFVNTYEGKDGKLGTVPMGKLHELYVAVCDWANQWEAFLKG